MYSILPLTNQQAKSYFCFFNALFCANHCAHHYSNAFSKKVFIAYLLLNLWSKHVVGGILRNKIWHFV